MSDLRSQIHRTVERAVNAAYGTDPRHGLLGKAVAEQVVDGTPWPWSLSEQFGQRAREPREQALSTSLPDPEDLPVGTSVLAWPSTRGGRALITKTRSKPWQLGHGDWVVSVIGHSGGIALTHIEILPQEFA